MREWIYAKKFLRLITISMKSCETNLGNMRWFTIHNAKGENLFSPQSITLKLR